MHTYISKAKHVILSDIDFQIGLDYKKFYRNTRIIPAHLFKDWESFAATHIWSFIFHMVLNSETRRLFEGSASAAFKDPPVVVSVWHVSIIIHVF